MRTFFAATVFLGFLLGACASAETIEATPETLPAILAAVNPGDTVVLADGVYKGDARLTRSGSAEKPIVIKPAGKSAVFDGGDTCLWLEGASWVAVEGIRFQNAATAGMKVRMGDKPDAEHVTVRNCVFADNKKWGIITSHVNSFTIEGCETFGATIEHGIYVANSGDDNVIRNNLVHHNVGNGIHMNGDPSCGGDGVMSRLLCEGNKIWENGSKGGSGLSVMHVQDSLFRNNLLYDNHATGIVLFWYTGDEKTQSSKRNKILNNTVFFRPGDGRLCLLMRKTAVDNIVKNNIFVGGKRGVVYAEPSCFDGFVSDCNVIANHPGQRLFGDAEEEEAAKLAPDFEKIGVRIDSKSGVEIAVADWQKKGLDTHSSIGKMPVFSDPFGGKFRLDPESVGIGMGEHLADVPADITGAPRPSDKPRDCGCYQSR